MSTALVSLVLSAIAIVVAVILVLLVEWLKRPRPQIVPVIWQPERAVQWTFAAVKIYNRPLRWPLGALLLRSIATACEVSVEFRIPGGGELVMPPVAAGWSSQPEPLRSVLLPGSGGNPSFTLQYDSSMLPARRRLDIPAGSDGHEVAIAVLRSDGTAHAFGAESYAHAAWKHPDWELRRQVYEVTVRAQASGVTTSGRFTLNYLAPDFATFTRLEPA